MEAYQQYAGRVVDTRIAPIREEDAAELSILRERKDVIDLVRFITSDVVNRVKKRRRAGPIHRTV